MRLMKKNQFKLQWLFEFQEKEEQNDDMRAVLPQGGSTRWEKIFRVRTEARPRASA